MAARKQLAGLGARLGVPTGANELAASLSPAEYVYGTPSAAQMQRLQRQLGGAGPTAPIGAPETSGPAAAAFVAHGALQGAWGHARGRAGRPAWACPRPARPPCGPIGACGPRGAGPRARVPGAGMPGGPRGAPLQALPHGRLGFPRPAPEHNATRRAGPATCVSPAAAPPRCTAQAPPHSRPPHCPPLRPRPPPSTRWMTCWGTTTTTCTAWTWTMTA